MGYLPQATEPALGATAAVRLLRSEDGGRTRNLTEIEGPLPVIACRRYELDSTQCRHSRSRYNSQRAFGRPARVPPTAVREILANALVHRDLGPSVDVGKKVEIRISDKALIITSPGGLRGLSVAQLESSNLTKAAVNKRLYEIARYLRLPDNERVIEGEGGGIQEVLPLSGNHGYRTPEFIDNGVEFKAILFRTSRFTDAENDWLRNMGEPLTPPKKISWSL